MITVYENMQEESWRYAINIDHRRTSDATIFGIDSWLSHGKMLQTAKNVVQQILIEKKFHQGTQSLII
jgi:hypothetical protein